VRLRPGAALDAPVAEEGHVQLHVRQLAAQLRRRRLLSPAVRKAPLLGLAPKRARGFGGGGVAAGVERFAYDAHRFVLFLFLFRWELWCHRRFPSLRFRVFELVPFLGLALLVLAPVFLFFSSVSAS
jgi:hypothetical protein